MAIKIEDIVKTTCVIPYELDNGLHFALSIGTPGVVYDLGKEVARVEIKTSDIGDPEAQQALRGDEGIYTEIALESLEVAQPAQSA